MLDKSCALNFVQYCKYFNSGIEKLWIGYTKNASFNFENNIIVDIYPTDWYNIKFTNARITSTLSFSFEETVLDLEVAYIDLTNKIELSNLKEKEYSFLVLTKNNEAFFIDSTKNTQFIQQYTANGFVIKQLSQKPKSIYQVSNNYILYIEGKLPIPPSVIQNCEEFYDDLALTSIQPDVLTITCLVQDYDGWI
jgi:hypothetical protein